MGNLVANGVVAFSNLTETEFYQGKDTGRYSLVLTLDDKQRSKLVDMGVNVKEYEGNGQRKFASKFNVQVVDLNDEPVRGEIPYGSKVRVAYALGEAHPQYGCGTYLNKVRVVEMAEGSSAEMPDEF